MKVNPSDLKATFLSSELVYLRAFTDEDSEDTQAWAGTWLPVGSVHGSKMLTDWHRESWPRTRRMVLCRISNDEIVGGVTIGIRHLVGEFIVKIAPWLDEADELRAAAFVLIVPWLSDEWGLVSVIAHVASDEPLTKLAAERLEMTHAGTMREFFARPGGTRADDLYYQKLRSLEARVDA